jgi:dihydroxy-acid dehydratase
MPELRSRLITHGREFSGARSLLFAAGVKPSDLGKPVVALANSYTQFVPGHVHLDQVGKLVAESVIEAGGIPREFNTIAVDDGIAMGHGGMLYSLPSRELIADSVEYMVNAHRADVVVCISNCDKITPGMLLAALRLNLPTVFVSGGPMEAGRMPSRGNRPAQRGMDLITAISAAADTSIDDEGLRDVEQSACPTCGSCSGMFTANSMNCLLEALGLALPGNGSVLATHTARKDLFVRAGQVAVELARRYYDGDDASVLPRAVASREAFENALTLDMAMGGSTNTILHMLAAAVAAELDFGLDDMEALSQRTPYLCKVAPSGDYHMEDVHRAGGIPAILGELQRAGLLNDKVPTVHSPSLAEALRVWDVRGASPSAEALEFFRAAPGGIRTVEPYSQSNLWDELDTDPKSGCVRSPEHAYSASGGLAVLRGNLAPDGAVIKTGGAKADGHRFSGPARIYESQDDCVEAILGDVVKEGDVIVVRYEGPRGGPGMQEMLYPTSFLRGRGLENKCAIITDGRFSGGSAGLAIGHISPEAAEGGPIGLIKDGDIVHVDIQARTLSVELTEEQLEERRTELLAELGGYRPRDRRRPVTEALRAYAALTTSASNGAARRVPDDGPASSAPAV